MSVTIPCRYPYRPATAALSDSYILNCRFKLPTANGTGTDTALCATITVWYRTWYRAVRYTHARATPYGTIRYRTVRKPLGVAVPVRYGTCLIPYGTIGCILLFLSKSYAFCVQILMLASPTSKCSRCVLLVIYSNLWS
jgi:hypothetical protein